MAGEIYRLRNWTDYRAKMPKGQTGMISEGFKTQRGYHTVVLALGSIKEGEHVTEEWLKAHLRAIDLTPVEGMPAE